MGSLAGKVERTSEGTEEGTAEDEGFAETHLKAKNFLRLLGHCMVSLIKTLPQ